MPRRIAHGSPVTVKKLFLIAGAAILLVLGVLVAIPAMLSSDTLRSNFAAQLSSITGSQIVLNGPVRFSIIPDFGIIAEDVAISTADRSAAVSVQRAVAAVCVSVPFFPTRSGSRELSWNNRQSSFDRVTRLPRGLRMNRRARATFSRPPLTCWGDFPSTGSKLSREWSVEPATIGWNRSPAM